MKTLNIFTLQIFGSRCLAPIGAGLIALMTLISPAFADVQVRNSAFMYNQQGLIISEMIEPSQPNSCLQTTYQYDGWGNRIGSTTASCPGVNGDAAFSANAPRSSSSNFGSDGRFPINSSNALGQSETKSFDARFGAVTSLMGPNNLQTRWTYDGFGRKTQEIRADGTSTSWMYLLCSDMMANCPGFINGVMPVWVLVEQNYQAAAEGIPSAIPSNAEGRQYFDSLNRVIRAQTQGFDGMGGMGPVLVQDTQYNNLGQVVAKSDSYELNAMPVWTRFEYDAMGRVVHEFRTGPYPTGGAPEDTRYSYNGLRTSVTNANGQTKTTTKNAQGQVTNVVDALGGMITYSYDAVGNLLSTNAMGVVTTLQYDQRGRKIAMQDPSMGNWTYAYNVFGELVRQTDSLGHMTLMTYDLLGRLIRRDEPDLISEWSYERNFNGMFCGMRSIGKLCEAKSSNGYDRKHNYDNVGRIASTSLALDNPVMPAVVSQTYDNAGRVSSKTWPTGFQANYAYTRNGFLNSVTGSGFGFPQPVNYQVMSMDSSGHVTQYKLGNRVTTVKAFDPITQRLTSQTATTDGQGIGNVLNQTYNYDALGNLRMKDDNTPGVGTHEMFSYDPLNRLTMVNILGGAVSPPTTTQVLYDPLGNITYKSDVGRYWYDAARPSRMTNVTLESAPGAYVPMTGTRTLSYVFDDYTPGAQFVNGQPVGNGNLAYTVSHDAANGIHTVRYESYTSFNMPSQVVYGNFITNTSSTADRTLSYTYGPEHQRVRQNVVLSGNGTSSYFAGNTWYMNGEDSLGLSYEKEVRANGTTEHKHYLAAGGEVFAQFTSREGNLNGLPPATTSYFLHDQLSSIVAITDENGNVTERLAYDPWGKRRNIMTAPGTPDTRDQLVGRYTERGFTQHEHLDEVGVIHMNGRIYDPLMGRFMSADHMIEAPNDLRSYNRYSYLWNNPLGGVDPSGFCWICDPIGETSKTLNHVGDVIATDPLARTGVTIAIAYFTGQWVGAESGLGLGPIAGGAVGGGAAAYFASNGDPQATTLGAFTGAAFGWAGLQGQGATEEIAARSTERYLAHAAAGCVTTVAGGGNCAAGAASAVFGKYATNSINFGNAVANGVATSIAGGVGSVIAGGKFENGATTAAFGYLFNCVTHKCYEIKPASGSSLTLSGGAGNGYYAQQHTIDSLRNIDNAWQAAGETANIVITEASQEIGPTRGHSSHQDGQDVDFRPMRTGREMGGLTYRSTDYDAAATQRLVNTILNVSPNARILFNDPQIQGVRPYPGHDNHLHVTLP